MCNYVLYGNLSAGGVNFKSVIFYGMHFSLFIQSFACHTNPTWGPDIVRECRRLPEIKRKLLIAERCLWLDDI